MFHDFPMEIYQPAIYWGVPMTMAPTKSRCRSWDLRLFVNIGRGMEGGAVLRKPNEQASMVPPPSQHCDQRTSKSINISINDTPAII